MEGVDIVLNTSEERISFRNTFSLSVLGTSMPSVDFPVMGDIRMLVVFMVFTYGFGFFSKLLFLFLLDIELKSICA